MENNKKVVACIGTGTMGFSTALSCALAGFEVKMYGRTNSSLEKGFTNIKLALDKLQKENYLNREEYESTYNKIKGFTSLEETCNNVDVLLESVAEDLQLKIEMFNQFARYCPEHTILGLNTSGLRPTLFAKGNERADKIVVIHFWNPSHLMPLVEIVPSAYTSKKTIEIAKKFVTALNKKPIVLNKEIPGFIGNRLQFALLREALYLLETGIATAEEIDMAVKYSFARRLTVTGPIETADLGGLDIFYHISSYLWADLSNATTSAPSLKEKYQKGLLGSKTGQGYYDWTKRHGEDLKEARETELIRWLKRDKSPK
ncbi:MAG: 3-hydroxyacyl-CoA dehydrogenase family protein [Peptococcales bacterium]|jgi:3-hydroxybutyryl-CoA dehydrogenase